jgi:hypothetical protein
MTDFRDHLENLKKESQVPALPPPQWPETVPYTLFAKQAVAKPKPLIKNLLDCGVGSLWRRK